EGIREKSDFKKVAEMLIYFDDFKFQVLLLDLLERLELPDAAEAYAIEVRANADYDFVYIEKYYSHLKKYYSRKARGTRALTADSEESVDHSLEGELAPLESGEVLPERRSEEEDLIIAALKYKPYTCQQLIDLSIGLLQVNFPRAALVAAELA